MDIKNHVMAISAPWMLKYLKNKEDANKYSEQSGKRVDVICPYCGYSKSMRIQDLYKQKRVFCPCGDSMSYPNKFMYKLLTQLGLDFNIEVKFDWSCGKVYDDYIEFDGLKIITEQHGNQHYNKPIVKSEKYRSVLKEKQNDKLKRSLALLNGIDYYFEIDCRNSEMQYIKNAIISSGLLDVLKVKHTEIDWLECDEFATSNFVKTICEYFDSHNKMTIKEVAEHFKIGRRAVERYINHGSKLGWCHYDEKLKSQHRGVSAIQKKRPVFCDTINKCFPSCVDASKFLSTNDIVYRSGNINNSAHKGIPYKGHSFHFITQAEFNNIKITSPEIAVGDAFIL